MRPLPCLALLLAIVAGPVFAAAPSRPNIVYIVADELGYFEPGYTGNPHLVTPHLDRLAAEGVRFTQGLAGSAVCAPTRCCLLTGKHSGHTSVRLNGGGTPLRAGEATAQEMLATQNELGERPRDLAEDPTLVARLRNLAAAEEEDEDSDEESGPQAKQRAS